MKIDGKPFRSIWVKDGDDKVVKVIDQRLLPHQLVIKDLKELDEFVFAIKEMVVRGAPLIGVTAAYGIYSALLQAPKDSLDELIQSAYEKLLNTRPTGSNLKWALDSQIRVIENGASREDKIKLAFENAKKLAEADVRTCQQIGQHGLKLIEEVSQSKNGEVVNILTHCNAGWLATVDYGTATAPIYSAHDKGIKVHVWVDETRPRNQGAHLTAYELGEHGIPHTVIVDNAGGHIMQHGLVDMCFVGTDRTTASGDVCNKIGTYLKALAAHDNDIPFYVALPSSTIDWKTKDALNIPIETRDPNEVKYVQGWIESESKNVLITPKESKAANYGFDVTPSKYVTALITELGVCEANYDSIISLFPEMQKEQV